MHKRGTAVAVGLVHVHSILFEETSSEAEIPSLGCFGELQGHWVEGRREGGKEGRREGGREAGREGGGSVEGEIGGGLEGVRTVRKEVWKRRGTLVR